MVSVRCRTLWDVREARSDGVELGLPNMSVVAAG